MINKNNLTKRWLIMFDPWGENSNGDKPRGWSPALPATIIIKEAPSGLQMSKNSRPRKTISVS